MQLEPSLPFKIFRTMRSNLWCILKFKLFVIAEVIPLYKNLYLSSLRIQSLPAPSNDRELAASGAIDGIADYAGEWVGGTGVHVGVGAAGTLADKTALRIPPQPH